MEVSMVKMHSKIVMMEIKKLVPYERNAKKHPSTQVERLAMHIEGVGWDQPIVVDENNVILKGHCRLLAAKHLKLEKIPVVVAKDLTEAQKKAVRLADNKLAESDWDDDLLKLDLEDLQLAGWDIGELGFEDIEIASGTGDGSGDESGEYTNKIESPIYKPTGPKPDVSELFDISKASELIKQIDSSSLPEEEKLFLRYAAYRHVVFNYQNIAEYYAHSPKSCQELMENSALVIIDFNKAIELGFVKMTKDLAEAYDHDSTE
jgi:ParB-like chromosome segregation protein Spo0J